MYWHTNSRFWYWKLNSHAKCKIRLALYTVIRAELKLILIKPIGALLLIWHYFFINFQICLAILKLAYKTSLSQDILMSKQCSGVKSYVKSVLAILMILGLDPNVRIDDFRACYQILESCSQLLTICLVYCFLFRYFC